MITMKPIRASVLFLAALPLAACEDKTPPPVHPIPAPNRAPATPPAAAPSTPPAASSGAPPATGAPAPTGNTLTALGVSMKLPDGWKQVPPSNPMRMAEVQVPDASGDAAKACVIAISNAGGDVQANVARWGNQVQDASGQPVKPQVQTKTVDGLNITMAELTGTYAGMNEAPKGNWTLRGAIVETSNGLLFIKMTGPAEQMAATSAAFGSMIDSIKKQ